MSRARWRKLHNDMSQIQITILLDDEAAARLREVARQRGESVERTAQALLLSALSSSLSSSVSASSAVALIAAHLDPDDPDGSKAITALLGTVHYPGVTGKVNTTNEEIDRLIAEEAMNPHTPKPESEPERETQTQSE